MGDSGGGGEDDSWNWGDDGDGEDCGDEGSSGGAGLDGGGEAVSAESVVSTGSVDSTDSVASEGCSTGRSPLKPYPSPVPTLMLSVSSSNMRVVALHFIAYESVSDN